MKICGANETCKDVHAGRTAAGLSSEIELKVALQPEDGHQRRVDVTKTLVLVQKCRGGFNSIQHWEAILCPRRTLLKRRTHTL